MTKPKKNVSRDQIREIPKPTFRDASKVGRPRMVLDAKQAAEIVYELAMIQCTLAEIGHVMHIDPSTVLRKYGEIVAHGKDHGKMSVRRMQYRKAMEGSVPMLQWLGKFWLGQRETESSSEHISEAKAIFDRLEGMATKEAVHAESDKITKIEDAPNANMA